VELVLSIKNLQKSYHGDIVLDNVSIELEAGEIVVIMGPSGCGKSTFIRCINNLVKADSGEIFFNDRAVHLENKNELQKIRLDIGFIFQHFNLVSRLNVKQNVAMGLIKKGLSIKQAYKKAYLALGDVKLRDKAEARVDKLSGGEKQRVGIARALVMEPELILMDEPTASLDPILVRDVLDIIESIVREKSNTSMIIVTHEVAFARRVADRVFFMDKGKFIESGKPDNVFDNPESWIGKKYKKIINYK